MTIVVASSNPAKATELETILRSLFDEPVEIVLAADILGNEWTVEESGTTLEENAYLKASHVFERVFLPTIADDTGLEVEALAGLPGVRTARFAGENATAVDNNRLLLEKLKDATNRRAQFRTVICYRDRFRTLLAEGICTGTIADSPRGSGGFGYDPLFVPDGYDRTFAEMETHEKNRLSHRARALQSLVERLRELWA